MERVHVTSGLDTGAVAHLGDPLGEQRALTESAGVVDLSNRGVVVVDGPERLEWLHKLLTQHVQDLEPFEPADALVLDANGRVEHHLRLVDDGTRLVATVEPGTAGPLAEYLQKMLFWTKATVTDATAEKGVLVVAGPDAHRVLAEAGLPAPLGAAHAGDAVVVRRRWPRHAWDLLVPMAEVAAVQAGLVAAGAREVGVDALEALRVEAAEPRLGRETDNRTIPHEVGWLETAVHLQKGCYRGQETVARVHNLGKPPRRLVRLHLETDGGPLPPHGTPLLLDGRQIGEIGTPVQHADLGSVALAVVKRNVADGTVLDAGGVPAVVESVRRP